jgi:hypothetical protein
MIGKGMIFLMTIGCQGVVWIYWHGMNVSIRLLQTQ